jgi:hypothetical protein
MKRIACCSTVISTCEQKSFTTPTPTRGDQLVAVDPSVIRSPLRLREHDKSRPYGGRSDDRFGR